MQLAAQAGAGTMGGNYLEAFREVGAQKRPYGNRTGCASNTLTS